MTFLLRNQRWAIRALGLGVVMSVISACSEQYADAVVAEPSASSGGSVSIVPGVTGAGGAGNEFGDDGEAHCGQACESERDCPSDYDCFRIGDDWQCVPESGSCGPLRDEMRDYVRTVLNDLRERRGLPALRSSECLDEIGQQAVTELETEGTFNTKFNRECASFVPNCLCDWREESQAFVRVYDGSWQDAVRYPFERAAQSDPDGTFFRNVVSDEWERVGVGVLLDNDYLRVSLEFAP